MATAQTAFTPLDAASKKELESRYSTPGVQTPYDLESWNASAFSHRTFVLIDRVHFDLNTLQPSWVGRKAGIRVLAEAAADGTSLVRADLIIAAPSLISREIAEELLSAFCDTVRVPVQVRLEPAIASLTLCVSGVGLPSERESLRQEALPGDALCVTGDLGLAMAGLQLMHTFVKPGADPAAVQQELETFHDCIERYAYPDWRADFKEAVHASGAQITWCRLLTDGLAQTVESMLAGRGLMAVVERTALPLRDDTFRAAKRCGADAFDWALRGGDDFEFVFTLPEEDVQALQAYFPEFRHIGTIREGDGTFLVTEGV